MSKEGVSFKNRDRFIQLGIAISTLRKLRGMSQDQLAEKANMSRSHLSAIEAPNMIRSFSLETLFNLADALMITPSDLLNTSLFSEQINELTDSEPIMTTCTAPAAAGWRMCSWTKRPLNRRSPRGRIFRSRGIR